MCPLNMYRKNKNKNKFDCKRKKNYFTLTSFQFQHWKNKDIDYLCQLYLLSLQWKLLTVDASFIADTSLQRTFFWGTDEMALKLSKWNLYVADTLWRTDLYGGHQIILPPTTDTDTSYMRHFLQEMCIHFTFDNILQLCLSFLWFLFYFLASLMACSGPRKCRDFQSVFISMVDMFSSCKDVQSVMDRDRNIDTIMEISVAHGQPLLLYKDN